MDAIRFAVIFFLVLMVLVISWYAVAGDGVRQLIVKRAMVALKKTKGGPVKHDIPSLKLDPKATRLDTFTGRILPNPEHWRRQLERTGTGWSLGTFGGIAAIIGLGVGMTTWMMGLSGIVCWGSGAFAGFYAPRVLVNWAIKKRSRKFLAVFPDAIGLMVRSVRSGLPVTEAVVNVGREMRGPVGEEFRKISDQIQLGQQMEEVMWQAAGRIELAEFTFMCISFGIQRETGGNLAETLDNLENLLHRRKQMALKIRAFSSEARASSGIIASLPFVMLALLSIVNWDYIQSLFTTSSGHMLLGMAGASLTVGIITLMKMGSFEI